MNGSVWILIYAYITNREGRVFAKQKTYGFSDTRPVNTLHQQKLQYAKALNKALATYRSNNNLDSDSEVGYTYLNSGITYEGRKNGKKNIKRKDTKLTKQDRRNVRIEVLRIQKEKSESGKHVSQEEKEKMYKRYDKKVSEKQYIRLNRNNKYLKGKRSKQIFTNSKRNKLKVSNTKQDKIRSYKKATNKIKQKPKGNLRKPPQ